MSGTSAFGAVSALAATQHGAFSRAQASERGLERGAIRRLLLAGVLDEPIPTVLVLLGTPRTWEQQAILPTVVSIIIGAAFGYVSEMLSNALTKKGDASAEATADPGHA